jgi:hypothetical protein
MNENEPTHPTSPLGFSSSPDSPQPGKPTGRGTSGERGRLQAVLNNKWAFLVIGLLLGGAAGAGVSESTTGEGSGASAPSELVATEQQEESSPEPEPTLPALEPNPDGTFGSSCDYILGDFSENTSTGFRFVAGADIENTGNVGIVVDVKATFKQLGGKPIELKKTEKVDFGESKSVQMTKEVGSNEIDLIQAAQDSGDICTVDVEIVDSYGEPQEA